MNPKASLDVNWSLGISSPGRFYFVLQGHEIPFPILGHRKVLGDAAQVNLRPLSWHLPAMKHIVMGQAKDSQIARSI